jgi:hypothetical protein
LTLSGATYETRADADPYFTRPQVAELVGSYLEAPTRNIRWLRRSTHPFPACPPSAFTSETTKCCWMIRANMSNVPWSPELMPGSMCGWGCHMDSLAASEN